MFSKKRSLFAVFLLVLALLLLVVLLILLALVLVVPVLHLRTPPFDSREYRGILAGEFGNYSKNRKIFVDKEARG